MPLARADQALAFTEPARRGEHQRERELGGGFGEHVGRVRHDDIARRERGEVEVVHADRAVRDDLELRSPIEDARVDPIEQQAHERVGVRELHVIDPDVPFRGNVDRGAGKCRGHERCQIDRQGRGRDDVHGRSIAVPRAALLAAGTNSCWSTRAGTVLDMNKLATLFPMLLVAACGDDGGTGTPVDSGGSNMDAGSAAKVVAVACPATPAATVMTVNGTDSFMPMNTTISTGGVVKFVMSTLHNVEPNPIAPMSDPNTRVNFGETKCLRFDAAGAYGIYCTTHSFAGTITVQ